MQITDLSPEGFKKSTMSLVLGWLPILSSRGERHMLTFIESFLSGVELRDLRTMVYIF